jgi:hypothetical protein
LINQSCTARCTHFWLASLLLLLLLRPAATQRGGPIYTIVLH